MPQTAPYIFYGHDVSYSSGKVRPAFAQTSLWMREVLPDILEIKRGTGLNYFPVVETAKRRSLQLSNRATRQRPGSDRWLRARKPSRGGKKCVGFGTRTRT